MSLGMYGQGQGAGRPPSIWQQPNSSPLKNPYQFQRTSGPDSMNYGDGMSGLGMSNNKSQPRGFSMYDGRNNFFGNGDNISNLPYPNSPNSTYPLQTINQAPYAVPSSQGGSGGSFLDGIGGMLGSATGLGGLLGGVTGLMGALGHSNLDLGEQRKQLGALSGNFQERGQEAWDFGKGLRDPNSQFYSTAKNEIGRQMDVGMDAQRTNAMVGVNSASAYRRSLGDLQRKMYEQLGSSMNQMYATGLQQSSQYGALASDLWRNRIGAESAIADMRKNENESSNAVPSQLMNMGGGLLGGLFGGILG